jgi:hypothetical protein
MVLFQPFHHYHGNSCPFQRLHIISLFTADSGNARTYSTGLYFLPTWPQFSFLTKIQKRPQKPRQRPWLQPAHFPALVGASAWNPHHSILQILVYSLFLYFPRCQLSSFHFSHLRWPPFPLFFRPKDKNASKNHVADHVFYRPIFQLW